MSRKVAIKKGKTMRGFNLGEFTDRYNQQCSIQDSSLATEACIWLGVDVDLNGNIVQQRMHLTQGMVKALMPYLQNFLDTGFIFKK